MNNTEYQNVQVLSTLENSLRESTLRNLE